MANNTRLRLLSTGNRKACTTIRKMLHLCWELCEKVVKYALFILEMKVKTPEYVHSKYISQQTLLCGCIGFWTAMPVNRVTLFEMPKCNTKAIHVGFMMGRVAVQHAFLQVFHFFFCHCYSNSVPNLYWSICHEHCIMPLMPNIRYIHHEVWCWKCWTVCVCIYDGLSWHLVYGHH
jgi:hypothetical protein